MPAKFKFHFLKLCIVIGGVGFFNLSYAQCATTADPVSITGTNCPTVAITSNKSDVAIQSGAYVGTIFGQPNPALLIRNATVINLNNFGLIQGQSTNTSGIEVGGTAVIKTLNNSSQINGARYAIQLTGSGSIETLNNTGTIFNNGNNSPAQGIYMSTAGGSTSIATINNSGAINSSNGGIYLDTASASGSASIGTINNNGGIDGGYDVGILVGTGNTVQTINNNSGGVISSTYCPGGSCSNGMENWGTINLINNAGTIQGGNRFGGVGYAIINNGLIREITNSNTISGGIVNNQTILQINNTASASGTGIIGNGNPGITNTGTITTLNNQQANLTLKGNLPANYNTIINSPTNYGKLSVTNPNGTTNFGIYQGSIIASGTTTYAAVLSGVTSTNITSKSGTYGGGLVTTSWSLKNSSGNTWDLVTSPTVVSNSPVVANSAAGSSLANQILVSYTAAAATTGSGSGSGAGSSEINSTLKSGTTLVSAVQSLTGNEVNQLASVHAEGYSSNMTIGLEQMKTVANTVMDRVHRPISDSNSNSLAYELDAGRYIWADVAGFTGTVNSYNGLAGFGYNSYYGVVGLDLFRNQTGGLGIYGGAGNSSMTQSSQVSQNFNNNSGYVGMYGGMYLTTDVKLSGALGYSFGNTSAKRYNPNIGDFTGGTASDSYSSNGAFAAVKLSHSMLIGEKFTLTPFLGGSYTQLNTGAVSETGGGDFNYSINSATSYQTITFAGAEFVQPLIEVGDNRLSAVGFYRFSYNWSANTDSAHTVTASNSVFGTFNQTGANMGPVSNLFGLGLQGQLSKDVSLRIGAVAAINSNGTQYGGGGELKIRF